MKEGRHFRCRINQVKIGCIRVIAACFLCGPVPAQQTLNIGVAPGFPGNAANVPVTMIGAGATNAVALQFEVAFDGTRASLQNALRGLRLTNHVIRSREVSSGLWRVLVYSQVNSAFSGTNVEIASLPVMVPANEYIGSGPITPAQIMLAKRDATLLAPVATQPGAVFVRPVNRRADGVVDFFMPSAAGTRYLIQSTTNFLHWETIGTNVATGDFMALVDKDAPKHPYRFYRWLLYDAAGEIRSIDSRPGGEVSLRMSGLNGRTYSVQASTNLTHWQTIQSQSITGDVIRFVDIDAFRHPRRFYRLSSDP